MRNIVVVGSMNMDLVTSVAAFPKPGETIHSSSLQYFPGGKGANQAVAAARSGASVHMIGAVGADGFAKELINNLALSQVDTAGVLQKEGHSGLALITVDASGENHIILAAGSNKAFSYEEIAETIAWEEAYAILLQNEIEWQTTVEVMKAAKHRRIPVWLNPAPALKVEAELLPFIHTCIVNESEAEVITGIKVSKLDEAEQAARFMLAGGVEQVIITLGEKGCLYMNQTGELEHVPAFQVQAVDTTAAGDTFIGAFAAASSSGLQTREALQFAVAAAALAVTKNGAQASIPAKQQIIDFISSYS